MSIVPNHRDFHDGKPLRRVTNDFVIGEGEHKGWTVQLVSDSRRGFDLKIPGQKMDIRVEGYIVGIAMRPPLWWLGMGRTHIGPLPDTMPAHTIGKNFAVTFVSGDLADWQRAFEDKHKGARRPRFRMPGHAPMLLGS